MIIGFDGSRAFQKNRTGTENYSFQLLQALAKIDKKNKYKVYLRPYDKGVARNGKEGWPENFQFSILNFQFLWTQIGLGLQTFKDKLDVLFVPAHTLPVIRKPGLTTVVTVHDLGSEYLPKTHQLKQRLYLGFMQKFQLKNASKIIAVSKATKEDLVKRVGLDPNKIKVVHEGFNKKLFRPIKGDTLVNSLSQYGLKPGNYYLFVGTVQPRKNLERLIRAFSLQLSAIRLKKSDDRRLMTDDLKLIIAGSKGWLSDEIYQLPKKLGIEDKVKFLGYVPEKDLPYFYSGAIALTFSSLFEGFGLPILEAQACGCPVVTSNVSSMPEVAGYGAVYVNPYSENDIVEGMERVRESESQRVRVIKAGFENIKRFSWEKCAEETLETLESL